MKIILKYVLNNIKERKLRTAVMLLSIVMSTVLFFVSLAIGDSYKAAQEKMAKGLAGTAGISVSAEQDANGNMIFISEEEIPKLTSIKNKVGILQTPAVYNKKGDFENIDVIAANLKELDKINKLRLVNDVELKKFSGYSIILPEKFTSKYGVKPGDTVTLTIGGKTIKFCLKAVAANDTVFLRSTRGFNALVPRETLLKILKASKGYSKILIEPAMGISIDSLKSKLSGKLFLNHYNITKTYDEKQVAVDAREKSMPFFLISFFSLTMSVFIIFSSYKMITLERLPVVGTFRSIGATEGAVTKILMLESSVYGVLGAVIGIPLGFGILKLMLESLGRSLALGIKIPMIVSPLNIILSCSIAIGVSLLSSYIPICRASKLPVKEVVLGLVEMKNVSSKVKLCFGCVLFIISVFLPHIVPQGNKLLMLAGGFSLLGLISATIIIIPLITDSISFIFERLYGGIFGNEGRLAARNMRKNKNVNQNITLIYISLSAVIAISVVGSFVNTYIGDVFRGAALDGFSDATVSEDFVLQVKNIKGVKEVMPIYVAKNSISCDNQPFERLEGIKDLNQYDSMLNIKYNSKEMRSNIEAVFNSSRNILLSENNLKKRGVSVGNTISLTSGDRIYKYKIIGSFKSRVDDTQAIIPDMYAKNDFKITNYGMFFYTATNPDAVMVQIRGLFGNKMNWSRTVKEFNSDALSTVSSFLSPMHKLTYFILLLAAIGVINNLLINYIQKKRSIAMYKSIGLSNAQNIKMTLIEGFSSGLIGAVVGISVSYLEIKTIFLVAGPKISMEPQIDISVFLMAGMASIIINLLGSIVPILKGSKMKLVEEIKFE